MKNHKLSPEALNDLSLIYEYSILYFGDNIANNYLLGLSNTFNLIKNNPRIGKELNLRRIFQFKSHLITYSIFNKETINFLRVIHKRSEY